MSGWIKLHRKCLGSGLILFQVGVVLSAYTEKFKDPRWQKLRLEIMKRDGFKCVSCGSENRTLHAHHMYYEKGFEPWEYDPKYIVSMCEVCHSTWHSLKTALDKLMADGGVYSLHKFLRIGGYIVGQSECSVAPFQRDNYLKGSEEFFKGVADYYRVTSRVMKFLRCQGEIPEVLLENNIPNEKSEDG